MKRGSEMTAPQAVSQQNPSKVAFGKVLAIQIVAYVVLVALALVPGIAYGDSANPAVVPFTIIGSLAMIALLVVFSPFRDGTAGHVIAVIAGLLSVVSDGDRTYTVLGADLVDLTDEIQTQFPDLNPAMIEDTSTGRWANFSVQSGTDGNGSDLFFTGSAMLEGREIPYDWYAAEITAAISYENGIFTLSDFHLNSLS